MLVSHLSLIIHPHFTVRSRLDRQLSAMQTVPRFKCTILLKPCINVSPIVIIGVAFARYVLQGHDLLYPPIRVGSATIILNVNQVFLFKGFLDFQRT